MRDDKKYLYRRNLPYRTGLKASVSHKISLSTISLHVWHDLTHLYKVEQGERRLDVIEYIWYCTALGVDPHTGIDAVLKNSSSSVEPASED